MIVSKANTSEAFENSPVCTGKVFINTGQAINGAVISVTGRYPKQGFLTNEICREIAYITKGEGRLLSTDSSYSFNTGDVVYVDKGDIFAWEGNFEGFFATTPTFDLAQHKEVAG